MAVLHAVADVPPAERVQRRNKGGHLVELRDGEVDHAGQHAALGAHVVLEHRLERRLEVEEPGIEELGDGIAQRLHLLPRLFDQRHLFRCHRNLPFSGGRLPV